MAHQKTAFVTGATGFFGLNLVEQLCAQGWRVIALHRVTSSLSWLQKFPVELVSGDILDARTLDEGMPKNVDAVFHTAADTSYWRARKKHQLRVNLEGTHRVLDAALRKQARCFVYTSTWASYGLDHDELDEHSIQHGKFSPRPYERSKALAEEAVRRAGHERFPVVIMNPVQMIGRYDRDQWTPIIRRIYQGNLRTIPPGGSAFCHAAEVAKAHIMAAEYGRAHANYLLGGVDAHFLDVVHTLADLTGYHVPLHASSVKGAQRQARWSVIKAALTRYTPQITPDGVRATLNTHPVVVSDRAEHELGYERASLETMLADLHDWLREEGLER